MAQACAIVSVDARSGMGQAGAKLVALRRSPGGQTTSLNQASAVSPA